MAHVRIELFGRFRVTAGGCAVPDRAWQRKKAAAVVKLLSLRPAHRMHREQIMDALWPELGSDAAAANLRKALHHARRALDGREGAGLIVSEGDLLAFGTHAVWVDVDAFRTELAGARRKRDIDGYRRALDLSRDGLLPEDAYEEWAIEARRELHLERLAASEDLAGLLESRGELDAAAEVLQQLVSAEPLREESHAALMRVLALAGRRAEALRRYEHLTRLLETELGTEPGVETQRLYEEIRARQAREPELTADLWERVGDLRMLSGDGAGAAKAFGLALASSDLPDVTAQLERKCAEAWLMQHRPDAASRHVETAAALVTELGERGRVLRARANLAWETGDLAAAAALAQEALSVARAHGTTDDLAAAHEAVAIVSHLRGEWRDGLSAELERLAIDSTGPAQLARVFDIHHCIGQYHLYGDGLADSVEGYARRILDWAEDAGAVRAQAFAWCLLGESLLLGARWDEASGCLERSCDLHATLGSRSGALGWQRRAELAVCQGAYDGAEACLRQASAIATVSSMASHLWGRIHGTAAFAALERGEPEQAIRSVRAAAAAAARYGDCPTCSALLNPMAAEAFALLADVESARRYADDAARVASFYESSAWRAMAMAAAASLAIAEGDAAGARLHHDAARELYDKAGQPYWSQRSARLAAGDRSGERLGERGGNAPPVWSAIEGS